MGAGVTDLEVGPDDALYVATSNAIWRFRQTPAKPDPQVAKGTVEPAPGDSSGGGNKPIAIVAGIVLVAGLAARFAAGRRLRRDTSED